MRMPNCDRFRCHFAHARRKIHDVHVRTPSALTEEALKRIGELYAIEAEIRGMTAEQ
ncbi:IS66 family transposase, partial [Escherichia coli]|uniref:IS66 family transposase n=1 Tax=Escherichia coli TaxID=562 RepID=UPI0024C172E9